MKKSLLITIRNSYVFGEYAQELLSDLGEEFDITVLLLKWNVPNWLNILLSELDRKKKLHYRIVPNHSFRLFHQPFYVRVLGELADAPYDIQFSDSYANGLSLWASANLVNPEAKRYCYYPAMSQLAGVQMFGNNPPPAPPRRSSFSKAISIFKLRGLRATIFVSRSALNNYSRKFFTNLFCSANFSDAYHHWTMLSVSGFDEMLFDQPEAITLFNAVALGPKAIRVASPGLKSVRFAESSVNRQENRLLLLSPFCEDTGFKKVEIDDFIKYVITVCQRFEIGKIDFRQHPVTSGLLKREARKITNRFEIPTTIIGSDCAVTSIIGDYVGILGHTSSALGLCRDFGMGGFVICIDDDRFAAEHPTSPLSQILFRTTTLGFIDQDFNIRMPLPELIQAEDVLSIKTLLNSQS